MDIRHWWTSAGISSLTDQHRYKLTMDIGHWSTSRGSSSLIDTGRWSTSRGSSSLIDLCTGISSLWTWVFIAVAECEDGRMAHWPGGGSYQMWCKSPTPHPLPYPCDCMLEDCPLQCFEHKSLISSHQGQHRLPYRSVWLRRQICSDQASQHRWHGVLGHGVWAAAVWNWEPCSLLPARRGLWLLQRAGGGIAKGCRLCHRGKRKPTFWWIQGQNCCIFCM